MIDDPQQLPYDHRRWVYELNRDHAHRAHDKSAEFFHKANSAAIAGGNLALKMAVLINGGAAISLLTFLGSLFEKRKGVFDVFAGALIWFASGVALAGAGFLLAYFTNYFTAAWEGSKSPTWEHPYIEPGPKTELWQKYKRFCHWSAAIAGTASLVLFLAGIVRVYYAFTQI
jgi:hypothetical protein